MHSHGRGTSRADFAKGRGGRLQLGKRNCSTKPHRCKKTFFTFFFIQGTFFNVFYFPTFFIFKNVHLKYHLKSLSKQRKQIGSVWLFFFVPMLEFPYRPIYWQALLFTYASFVVNNEWHQVTPLGVVFLFMLVNWWVGKHQRFLFNVYKRFFFIIFVMFFVTFFNVFYFFWNVFFLHLCPHAYLGSNVPLPLAQC